MTTRNILLTTDFSDNARAAYSCATQLAIEFDAQLHLVHFAGAMPNLIPSPSREMIFDAMELALAEEIGSHSAFEGVDIQPRLERHRWTSSRQLALEQELEADVIVMSPQGKTGLSKILLGSFADRVIGQASVPVLLFRPTEDSQAFDPRSVLVPHLFYDRPRAVLPAMRWLNSHFHPKFRFLHVYDPRLNNLQSIRGLEGQIAKIMESIQSFSVEGRFAELVTDELQGLDVTLETAQGFPSQEIVQRANRLPTDLVLLGKLEGLGGVARFVIRETKCSVLTVPVNNAQD
ncbi:MAG: universal stress protein [Planctomycetaceae bacterium]|nr:universal stress protein [Planctomycetaceae bacterium]